MAKSLILSVFALCIFGLISCDPVEVIDCGTAMSTLEKVYITGCPPQPCELKKGTEMTVQVQFTPKENITAATTVVHGYLGPVPIPFPVANPDACKEHGITCPMIAGKEYTFKSVLPIKSIYPSLQVVVEWKMEDQNKNIVYCWKVAAKIVSGLNDADDLIA